VNYSTNEWHIDLRRFEPVAGPIGNQPGSILDFGKTHMVTVENNRNLAALIYVMSSTPGREIAKQSVLHVATIYVREADEWEIRMQYLTR
jgi:hypothetical protein